MIELAFWQSVILATAIMVGWLCLVDLTVRVARRAWKGGR